MYSSVVPAATPTHLRPPSIPNSLSMVGCSTASSLVHDHPRNLTQILGVGKTHHNPGGGGNLASLNPRCAVAFGRKIRSALCISGGNRRRPPTPSSPDHAAADGEGGEGGEDLLSELPDDVLLHVLARLPSAAAAARTSILSRRWRRLWAHLPGLLFPHPADPLDRARAALAAHAAPALRLLLVSASAAADPGAAAAILSLAAPRLTGGILLGDVASEDRKEEEEEEEGEPWARASIELPCFEKADLICLSLGYLGLALPPSGVFAKLTVLFLHHVSFLGPCDLGDALSSTRCPSLRTLGVSHSQGLSNLTFRSESLLSIYLRSLDGLQQLTVVAPMLRKLFLLFCFFGRQVRQPVADISAPVLEMLWWRDGYYPISVHLGEMANLQRLSSLDIMAYGPPHYPYNWDSVMLLQRFQKLQILDLVIAYPTDMVNRQYLMEAITLLPNIEILQLHLFRRGHACGPCVFHLLRISSGIRKLKLLLYQDIKAQNTCSLGCACDEPRDWETEELLLSSLQEVEIYGWSGAECEFEFLKRLLRWAAVLKAITVTSDPSIAVSEEHCQELLGLSGPETSMMIYLYRDGAKVMYAKVG